MALDQGTVARLASRTWIANGLHILAWVAGAMASPEVMLALKNGGWVAVACSLVNLGLREVTTKPVDGWVPKK